VGRADTNREQASWRWTFDGIDLGQVETTHDEHWTSCDSVDVFDLGYAACERDRLEPSE
jgi:hypothetical protein